MHYDPSYDVKETQKIYGRIVANRLLSVKSASDDSSNLQRLGKYLSLAGVAVPLFFMARGRLRGLKLTNLVAKGALPSHEIDSYIKNHMAASGKKLPSYKWLPNSAPWSPGIQEYLDRKFAEQAPFSNFIRRLEQANGKLPQNAIQSFRRTSDGPIPVFRSKQDVLTYISNGKKDFKPPELIKKMNSPMYVVAPGAEFIYMGDTAHPKMLMHELGHAQDRILKNPILYAGNSQNPDGVFGTFKSMFNPDSSKILKREISAWENAGIGKGDKIREAALNTYRNAIQNRAAQFIYIPAILAGNGAYLYGAYRNRNK